MVVLPALVADRICIAEPRLFAARLRLAELRKAGDELTAKLSFTKRSFARIFPCGIDWVYAQGAIEEGRKKLIELRDHGAPVSDTAAVERDIKDAEEFLQSLQEDLLRRTDNGRITMDMLNEDIGRLKQQLADNHSEQEILEKQLGIGPQR